MRQLMGPKRCRCSMRVCRVNGSPWFRFIGVGLNAWGFVWAIVDTACGAGLPFPAAAIWAVGLAMATS